MMSMTKHSLLVAALLAATPLTAAEIRGTLLPATAIDLVPATLSASTRAVHAQLESQPVDFAWAIDTDSKLEAAQPHVAESREFWSLQSSAQLERGFRFTVGSPGALVRVSPAEGSQSGDLADRAVEFRFNGRSISDGAGILRRAEDDQLRALGTDFGDGSRVFQLDPALGAGAVELRIAGPGGRHLIHVLEPASEQVLTLTTDRSIAVVDGQIGVHVDWRNGRQSLLPERVEGLMTAPDGRTIDLVFRPDGSGRYHAHARLPSSASSTPGLWEVHVFAAAEVNRVQQLRDARTSFAVSEPSARLSETFRVTSHRDGLQLALGVQAAAAGRYELRGTVFGTLANGKLVPFAVAHAARMLDAGEAEITLDISSAIVREAGVHAPFEVRDLSLNNQGSFSRMESRALALRIDALPTASTRAR
jgi:hypothetical protein